MATIRSPLSTETQPTGEYGATKASNVDSSVPSHNLTVGAEGIDMTALAESPDRAPLAEDADSAGSEINFFSADQKTSTAGEDATPLEPKVAHLFFAGLFQRKESYLAAVEGMLTGEKIQEENNFYFSLGPEYHHIFAHEGDDDEPEYEEAWTDTFYDLFLVGMMAKTTRLILQDVTEVFKDTDGVDQNYQDF